MNPRGQLLALAVWAGAQAGCATTEPAPAASFPAAAMRWAEPPASGGVHPRRADPTAGVNPAARPAVVPAQFAEPLPADELTADAVVREVLARNPTVAEMAAAVAAAAARYPQVTSLADPTFTTWVAPASLGSTKVNDSARFELSQKFPYPGKLALRGESALARTAAAEHDLADAKLQLAEAARTAHADYFLAERGLEVNREGLRRLDEFRKNAETRVKTAQAPLQDVLQADVEIGRQTERRLALERARAVAVARLNTLMNRPPDAPLPPPPAALGDPVPLPEAAALREAAFARRPDLRAAAARVAAERAAVALAKKEFYPDVEGMAAYDSFWQAADMQQRLRPQVGVRVDLPVRLARRRAAVAEAEAELARRQAELDRLANRVAFDVAEAHARVTESERAARLYAGTILPAARENVSAAQAAYVAGRVPFVSLVEAQRALIDLQDRAYQAEADARQRRAALERAAGGPF